MQHIINVLRGMAIGAGVVLLISILVLGPLFVEIGR